MHGKRGENPPLPRNCERPLKSAKSHCPSGWEGADDVNEVASQETGLVSTILANPFRGRKRTLMFVSRSSCIKSIVWLLFSLVILGSPADAKSAGTLRGTVLDPLGAAISNAKVVLIQQGNEVKVTSTDQDGVFVFSPVDAGRYSIRVEAPGFQNKDSSSLFLSAGATLSVSLSLQIGSLPQQIVVSATGTEVLESQVGASVSVIDHQQLQDQNQLAVSEALRTVPGLQIVQTGQRGGTTSLFVRGGESDFNKVLIDGIPANDVGGAFEFANLSSAAVDQVEILRGPNSVLYGSDALSSVINITTRRGTSLIPEFRYSVDGGNFGTLRDDVSVAGAFRQFDYFSEFSRFDTKNSLANSAFHDGTYAGSFGWAPNSATQIRFTLRHTGVAYGVSNALGFFGIPDDSFQNNHDTYWGVTLQNQTTTHWRNLLRFASGDLNYHFVNPSPTGAPFDPFASGFPNYIGHVVTIRGANGYSVTGQAILDFGGIYPQPFDSHTTRRSFYAQSDYTVLSNLDFTAGFRYENENGFTNSSGLISPADRNNYSPFLQANWNLAHRLYATAGGGFENNAVFGFAATPRVSLAYYLLRPSANDLFSGTKLTFNFGKGIKEPSIFQQGSSLFATLASFPGGAALLSKDGISPIGPERSRSFDFGVDQGLWNNRARFGVTLFRENYYDLIEFVNPGVLAALGVPPDITNLQGFFGANINSSSFRALGAEVRVETKIGRGLLVQGEYTYLDAVVTHSFTGSVLSAAINPSFPNIPIGAFSPLVGARPFNRAPHSGSLLLDYTRNRFGLTLSGYFAGRRDGSTFLSDGYFGNSLLLPNRNLQAAYQLLDLSGRYSVNRHVSAYFSITNLLSQHYQEQIGYPALPLAFRTGLTFTLGGEGGWWK